MTEHRPPYTTQSQPQVAYTPLELQVQRLERELRIAHGVIHALLEREGMAACPCCGYRLKTETDASQT